MKIKNKIYYFLPAVLYCALIFFLSSKSLKIHLHFIYWDKGAHWIEFLVLGFLLAIGFFHNFPGATFLNIYLTFMTGIFIGLTDELHQKFVPGRQCDWKDWIADIIGILTGLIIYLVFEKQKYQKNKKQREK
jgi:VanZ family protein